MPNLKTTLFLILASLSTIYGDFVQPNPRNECKSGILAGYTQCYNEAGCCFGVSICCAGGCCPIDATCVNKGLSNEGCCPFSDKTNCGAPVASFSKPACTRSPSSPKPSVQCVSADDDWYCPPGSVCGTVKPLCHDFFDLGCTSVASMSAATATSPPSTATNGAVGGSAGATAAATTVRTGGTRGVKGGKLGIWEGAAMVLGFLI